MIKAIVKSLLLILWIFFSTCLLWLVKKTGKKKWRDRFCNFAFAVICVIIGIRVKVEGEVAGARPLLLVSNHISYLDILILGWKTTARFTPKNDIAKWPVISTVCRLLDCVFIDRANGSIKEVRGKIYNGLAAGEVISLFPEGTTGNGRRILPFKSSLFSIAEEKINMKPLPEPPLAAKAKVSEGGKCSWCAAISLSKVRGLFFKPAPKPLPDNEEEIKELFIQPAIISYISIGCLPIDSSQWPAIAWYGDMLLLPHVWQMLKLGRIDARLTLLPPVTISQFGDRKQLAAYCHDVAVGVLQGR